MARSGKGLMARQLLLVTASAAASAPIVSVVRPSGDRGRAVITRRVAAERPQRPCAGPSVAAWAAWTAARPGSRTPAPTAPGQPAPRGAWRRGSRVAAQLDCEQQRAQQNAQQQPAKVWRDQGFAQIRRLPEALLRSDVCGPSFGRKRQ